MTVLGATQLLSMEGRFETIRHGRRMMEEVKLKMSLKVEKD